MDDEPVSGSMMEAKGAGKAVPSLALALLPRPQILAMGDPWQASDDNSERSSDDTVPDAGDGFECNESGA
jgi:hypothetical protein